MEKAWKCILDEYFSFACTKSMEEGKGVHVFHFLDERRISHGCNCHYFYSKMGGSAWEDIVESSEENKKMLEKYDPDSMIFICIRIPCHGQTKESLRCLDIFPSQKQEVTPEVPKKKEGGSLRKRKV